MSTWWLNWLEHGLPWMGSRIRIFDGSFGLFSEFSSLSNFIPPILMSRASKLWLFIIIIIIIIKYAAYWQVLVFIEVMYISSLCSIDKLRSNLFRFSASFFSSQYLLLLLKSLRSCVLLLSSPSTFLSVFQWHHEGGNLFSEFDQCNWLIYVEYYLEVSSALLYSRTVHQLLSLTIPSSPFSSSTTFQSSPDSSAPILLVSRSLSHMDQILKKTINITKLNNK